jgi:hypothetical protein
VTYQSGRIGLKREFPKQINKYFNKPPDNVADFLINELNKISKSHLITDSRCDANLLL